MLSLKHWFLFFLRYIVELTQLKGRLQMKKTNISNLFFTVAVGVLLVGCGGGSDYDTSKDFTKLEGSSNPTFEQTAHVNTPKEVDVLAEQYRVDQANKNNNVTDATYNSNLNNTMNNSTNTNVVENQNQQIGTMPVSNPSIPPITNNEATTTPPQGEVNVISEANTNQ